MTESLTRDVFKAGLNSEASINLPADPTQPLEAATKAYVDTTRVGRNRLINGDFSVNQRGTTSVTTNGSFTFDHWALGCSTATASVQTAALGELPESARSYARVVTPVHSATNDNALLRQSIESVRTLSGKTVTVSFWAKAAAGTPKVAVELYQQFGQGGTPSGAVSNYLGQATLNTTWTRYSVSGTLAGIAGKQFGTDGKDKVDLGLWVSSGSNYNARNGSIGFQSGTFDFWGMQVEEGEAASTFEQKSYADELRACQRYYYRTTGHLSNQKRWAGQCTSAGAAEFYVPFPTTMRATPTLGFNVATQFFPCIASGGGAGAFTALSTVGNSSSPDGMGITGTGSSSLVAGNATLIGANSYLEFNAEL